MRRSTFYYICGLLRIPSFEDMMARDHTFFDGRMLTLQDRVAIALKMLKSGGPPDVVGSSLGINESTALLVTQRFVEAMWERAFHHVFWPNSAKMDKIKRKFDKIHGLPNCCGALYTTQFGSQKCDHDENENVLFQALVDPDLRFTNIWLGSFGSMNHLSLLYESMLFQSCEEGIWLNGGEYIIGDAGYPFLPWLLTPYHVGVPDSPHQAEFNRRYSTASNITLAALMRLKDSWKILDKAMWRSVSSCSLPQIIYACCMLHNIVIDMEEVSAGMPGDQEEDYMEEVRQFAYEDLIKPEAAEAEQLIVVASGSGDRNKEQEAFRLQKENRGKEKVD